MTTSELRNAPAYDPAMANPTAILPTTPGERAALTLAAAQRHLARAFEAADLDTPALDARRLITGVLGLDAAAPLQTPDRPLSAAEADSLEAAGQRRLTREPVSRILGQRQFYGLDLEISPATLDPRPDTEALVDGVLKLASAGLVPGGPAYRIADIGTGSGAILLALLQHLPGARGLAVDVCAEALAVARRNAQRLSLAARLETRLTSWLDGIPGPYDLIVSNPPYIPTAGITDLDPEVAHFDPHRALDGGADGLAAYRALIPAAAQRLAPGGWLALEIGASQTQSLLELLALEAPRLDPGSLQIWPDLAGQQRCVAVQAQR